MNYFIEFCKKLKKYLEKSHENVPIALGCFLLVLAGYVDSIVPPEVSLSVLYLLPVSLTTWFISKEAGVLTSVLSALAWFVTNLSLKEVESGFFVHFWNAIAHLIFLLLLSDLLHKWRHALTQEKELERIDSTTKVANKRLFLELAHLEVKKSQRYRHPLTIVYIDIDDFKKFNDTLGSQIGDKVLRLAAKTIKNHLRETDIVARFGGDEFVILLPGSGYQPSSIVVNRLQVQLLNSMLKNKWYVKFSISAVTFINPPSSVEVMLQRADHLMYVVKNEGKNQLKHITAS